MPIWCHQLVSVLLAVAGFVVGALLGFGAFALVERLGLPMAVLIPTSWLLILGLGFGGIQLGGNIADRIAARCPRCRGKASIEGHRPNRYRCRECGHLEKLSSRSAWGKS
jgi:hypothetical protein